MPRMYSEYYDCVYDSETLEWLEKKCGDPDCQYCSIRPPKAIPKDDDEEIAAKWLDKGEEKDHEK